MLISLYSIECGVSANNCAEHVTVRHFLITPSFGLKYPADSCSGQRMMVFTMLTSLQKMHKTILLQRQREMYPRRI